MSKNYAVVMAGGQGTRFWPESVSTKPKQYLNLVGEKSLLNQTLTRFGDLILPEKRFIVTVDSQYDLAKEHSRGELNNKGVILEPAGRNTAPCILLSLASLIKQGASLEDVITIVPADHIILNEKGFQNVVSKACEKAKQSDAIVTIGITPNFPHTGYGYIEKDKNSSGDFYNVCSFKEKPDATTATEYLKSGNFLWNAGMFVAKIGFLLNEFKEYAPETYSFYEELLNNIEKPADLKKTYEKLPKDSIDYAIMEKSKSVLVIPSEFDWNDLGSWDALESVTEKREENTIAQAKEIFMQNAKGNIVFAPGKFVSLINVDDLIVVANDNNLMVLPKKDSQSVKNIVTYLQSKDWGKEHL